MCYNDLLPCFNNHYSHKTFVCVIPVLDSLFGVIQSCFLLFRLAKKMSKARQLIVNKHAANDGLGATDAEARFIEVCERSVHCAAPDLF